MGKWTDQGFVTNSLSFYKEMFQEAFVAAYGDDFSINDDTPQGVLIQRLAELFYNADMDGVEAFSRLNINSASGVYLDLFGNMRGMPRGLGTPQTATVTVTCNTNNFVPFTIPAGTIFALVNSPQTFVLPNGYTTNSATFNLSLEYSESGNSDAIIGDKLQVTGFSQITDIEITNLVAGQGREGDIEYRKRLQTEYPTANNTIEWVEGRILELQIVKTVGHNYNDTSEQQGLLPPYTTEWMAVPAEGADMDAFKTAVGTVIINNKVPGSPTYGNTTVQVTDLFGTQKTVNFTIPTKVELQIQVTVSTPETTGFLDLSNITQHKVDIANYINSLNIGKDVSYSRCAEFLFNDKGFDVQTFKIKALTDQDWVSNGNYTISEREYASIATANIAIEV